MMEIYAVKYTTQIEASRQETILSCLSPERQAALRRFRKWESAQSTLAGELLVRTAVYRKLGIGKELSFGKNQYGKPYITGHESFHYNISHSGQWVVCAFDDSIMGIDVEEINPIDFAISEHYFSPEEHEDLMAKPEDERLSYFFDLWTLKEAYIKAVGMGLSMPLKSFTMKRRDNYDIEVKTENEFRNCFFRQYDIDPHYKLSVCSTKNEFPEGIGIVQIDSLCDEFLKIYK